MTIETTTRKVIALGNGTATSFSFSPLVITQDSDLVVVKTDSSGIETTLTLTTDYTVSVSDFPGTGSITYPATGTTKLASGEKITMRPVLPLTQSTALNNQGGYFADVQEDALDKLTLLVQQLQEQLDRCIKTAVSDSDNPTDLPTASLRAGKGLAFNDDGDPIAGATPSVTISAIMDDVVQATSLANARTALGLASGATTTVGTAATKDVGTGANDVVQLDASSKLPAVDGSALTNLTIPTASQADQETGTSTTKFVTPGHQQSHQSAAKGWCVAQTSGVAAASYNVSSVTDSGTGHATINWNTDFSSGNYAVVATLRAANGASLFALVENSTIAAGSSEIYSLTSTTGVAADPNLYNVIAFGDQ